MEKPILWVPEAYLNQPTGFLKIPAPALPEEEAGEDQTLWVVDEERSTDWWLEVNDGEGFFAAVVKWDGCIHLYEYAQVSEDEKFGTGLSPTEPAEDDEVEYTHICDLDQLIERLQALKQVALRHFEGNWPG